MPPAPQSSPAARNSSSSSNSAIREAVIQLRSDAIYPVSRATLMHRALRVEGIIAEICRSLGARDLVSLLQASKLFRSTAQTELWKTHATLEALMFALPDSIVSRRGAFGSRWFTFTKLATPSDWAETRKLASMIQLLDQPRITYLAATAILELISNGPTTSFPSPLCPQIHTLFWTAFERTHIYAAKLFTSPSLKFIRLTLGENMTSSSDAIDVFLEHVSLSSPALEHLEVVSSTPHSLSITLNSTYMAGYTHLRSIILHISLISDPILRGLAILPHLHTFRAHVSSRQPESSRYKSFTLNSLHTLSLTGGRLALVDLLIKMRIPKLNFIELIINDITDDATFIQLNVDLRHWMPRVSNTHISLTHRKSSIGVTSALSFCTSRTHEFVLHASNLSSETAPSSTRFFGIQRMILRATAGWKQALPVLKLPDLLRYFPSLTYLEMGLDAGTFSTASCDVRPHQSALSTLVIYPGPIHSAWPTASFLSSTLPSTRITVEIISGCAVAWNEVAQAIPSLQRFVLAERRCAELEQENVQLRERLRQEPVPATTLT